ncbi:MAG: 50S ribosomal protein L9 [Candidatus Eisenbacteria bacterium]|uniref:Large ribosomal subunit protein bL9 n=1 Tax=Eiseniibacteriota bacterium TaxID=2212470 RepID=A0A538TFH9_UNCEI|nr:MAG: 50S ribosomal protein L9 [Candidatus Eisenbacteria bacterium]
MEIILLEDIGGLGKRGTAVRVADGYARNFLIPRKKAIEAVGNARAVFKDRERARVALEAKQRQAAEKLRDDLAQISLQFSVEAGEDDQLYGSVTAHEIQDALSAKGHTIERKNVRLPEPIKSLGVFEIAIHLYEDIEAPVKVWVVRK